MDVDDFSPARPVCIVKFAIWRLVCRAATTGGAFLAILAPPVLRECRGAGYRLRARYRGGADRGARKSGAGRGRVGGNQGQGVRRAAGRPPPSVKPATFVRRRPAVKANARAVNQVLRDRIHEFTVVSDLLFAPLGLSTAAEFEAAVPVRGTGQCFDMFLPLLSSVWNPPECRIRTNP